MDGKYTATARTVTTGESAQVAINAKAAMHVVSVDSVTGVPIVSSDPVQTYVSNPYLNLLNSGLVKSGAGTLSRIAVGAAGTTITITAYDNTAGSGTILFGPYVLVAGASIQLDFAFGTGCYVAFSATTGTPNITVGYR